jgi:hypothetical protein
MKLDNLAFKQARSEAFAWKFETMSLCFNQTSSMISAPEFPDFAPQTQACQNSLIAHKRFNSTGFLEHDAFIWNRIMLYFLYFVRLFAFNRIPLKRALL